MTFTPSRQLQTGLAGSLMVHGVLLLLLVAGFSFQGARWTAHPKAPPKPREKEVVLLFPIAPPEVKPPPPKMDLRNYIRTTQNEAVAKASPKAGFISDRNTTAASEKAAAPDATLAMPTTAGIPKPMNELANRDYKDGELREDALPKALPLPQMLTPQGAPPEPAEAASSSPPAPAAPVQVAKAEPAPTPLNKMIEEMDREAVRMEVNRLPLEVRKAGDAPPPAATSEPKVADAPPAMKETPTSKAEPPIANPITTAGNRAQKDAFTPFTRTSAIKGTITNRGQNAVDAEKTPLGVYMRGVTGAVEKKWHVYRRLKQDAVTFGSLRVRFFVTRDGTPEDLKIISDPRDADPRMADFTLRAIKDAEIPPIPEDLLPMLDSERVKIEYDVLIY